jgi:hypothetical protein
MHILRGRYRHRRRPPRNRRPTSSLEHLRQIGAHQVATFLQAVCVALGVRCARSCLPLVFIGRAPMLNDTTKPGEVLHKGGLDLLTLLHRRDVELHAHLTLWCSNDDQQRCEHFDHGFITRPSSPRLPFRGGPHDRQNIGRRRQIASFSRAKGKPRHARFCCGGVPGPFVRKGEQRSRYANGCDGLVFLRRKENPATAWQLVAGLPAPLPSFRKEILGPPRQRLPAVTCSVSKQSR